MQTYALKVFLLHSQISLGCSGKSYAYTFWLLHIENTGQRTFPPVRA